MNIKQTSRQVTYSPLAHEELKYFGPLGILNSQQRRNITCDSSLKTTVLSNKSDKKYSIRLRIKLSKRNFRQCFDDPNYSSFISEERIKLLTSFK